MCNFTFEPSPKPIKVKPLEADSLPEVMMELKTHNLVAWCERQKPGAAKVGGRFIKFGWKGCNDILEQLKDERFFAVECKRLKDGKLTDKHIFFLEQVRQHGGVSFVATSLHDVSYNLKSGYE